MEKIEVQGLTLSWLTNLKNTLLANQGVDGLRTGYLASARYIDKIISTIMDQQTRIAELENQLEIEEDYASAWGDFAGYTPQELTPEQREYIKTNMKAIEEKWRENFKHD